MRRTYAAPKLTLLGGVDAHALLESRLEEIRARVAGADACGARTLTAQFQESAEVSPSSAEESTTRLRNS
jgi:hypothetical protein